jgi:hypothetical protein
MRSSTQLSSTTISRQHSDKCQKHWRCHQHQECHKRQRLRCEVRPRPCGTGIASGHRSWDRVPRCRNQGPRVFQVGKNQVSRRRAAARYGTGRAAATVIELSGRPCNRRRLRPPIPRRDRPCRNEGPRAFSSRTRSTAAAASRLEQLSAASNPRSCSRLSRSSPAHRLTSSAARQPLPQPQTAGAMPLAARASSPSCPAPSAAAEPAAQRRTMVAPQG